MDKTPGELIPGTFDMLVLKALSLGAMHGWGVAERIERLSDGACSIQQGTVYPVLRRLLRQGWVVAEWRDTEAGRRARFYKITHTGRRRLGEDVVWWRDAIAGVDRVLRAAAAEG